MRISKFFKHSLAFLTAFLMLLPSFSFSIAKTNTDTLFVGDANNDKEVNTYDVVCILKYCVGTFKLDYYNSLASDLDADGEIDTLDAALLLRNIASSSDVLQPMEIVGDLKNPVLYADMSFTLVDNMRAINISLSEYTADAVRTPSDTVSFGQGFEMHLNAGVSYVFETQMSGDNNLDTVLYLLDGANNAFLKDDNSGDAKYSRIEFYCWQEGNYKVLVTGKTGNEVGTCRLNCGEHKYLEPTATPVSTPGTTPSATPTASPTPADEPEPTQTPTLPVTGMAFINETVPENGTVVQYRRARTVKGTIITDKAIMLVRAEVLNKDGKVEISAERQINASLELTRYALTDGGNTSVNNKLAFSELSIGTKTFKLYCKTQGQEEQQIFTSEFYVGATDDLLEGYALSGSAALSSSARNKILDCINSLPEDELSTKAVMEIFTHLGTPYGTGSGQLDCSALVQKAYADCGISLPRTSCEQGRFCYELNGEIPREDIKPGDLVFFRSLNCNCGRYREIHHVAMLVCEIDDVWYYIEASSGKRCTLLRREWGNNTSGWKIEFYGRPY